MDNRDKLFSPSGNALIEIIRNKNFYQKMIETMNDGLCVVDARLRVVFANNSMCRISGYRLNELIGSDCTLLLDEENRTLVREQIIKRKQGGTSPYEVSFNRKDGEKVLVRISPGPVLDDKENFMGSFAMVTDITSVRKAEKELEAARDNLELRVKERTAELESAVELLRDEINVRLKFENMLKDIRKRFLLFLDNFPGVAYIKDSDGRFIFFNKKLENMFNKKRDEWFGKTNEELFPEKIAESFSQSDRMVLLSGAPVQREEITGDQYWLNYKFPIRFDKNRNLIGGVAINITDRKLAEEQLKKAKNEINACNRELENRVKEKTEELLKSQEQLIHSEKLSAMGRMASGLAHELNSPLSGLLPMVEKYLENAEEGSREHREFSLMTKACKHMARIIRDFNTFSRETKGNRRPVNLNEVIDDTLSFSSVRLKQMGIDIIKEYDENLPVITGNKTELQQIVLNMTTNACDAMPEGGVFTIRTFLSREKKTTVMEFSDSGTGIEKQNLGRIFDPFFTTKEPGKGTGLGLSVSYGIVKRHGGEIIPESEPGRGTKFTVMLPV